MSSATLRRLLASTSFRMALLCAGVVVAAFALAALGTWLVTKVAAERTARDRLQLEMSLLQGEVLQFGQEAAIVAIQLRARLPGAFRYRFVDGQGRVVAGDLPIDARDPGWSMHYEPDTVGGGVSADFVVFSQPLSGGGYLAVAEDLEHSEWARYAVLRTLFWFAMVAVVLSLGAGYLISQRTLRRMQEIFLTMERVGGGDFAARVPARPVARESDLDGLGRNINAMLTRVDALVRNLRRVSTEIAHDLRTPLTNVLHDLEAATKPTPAEAFWPLQSARRRIEDILRTFDAMLRLAEIEAGTARSRFVDVDLADLAERVGDAYRPDVENVGGRLDVQTPEALHVRGDPHLLAQALSNLIENALRHGGERPHILIQGLTTGYETILVVQDNGPGIPRESLADVIKPHVRLDSSRTSPGAGLGLSIVAAVAQLHEALLTLEDAKPGLCVKLAWRVN
ncbi:MAG TPA: hypothetical protein DHW63_01530 [Hyphomonadaceae bacterium]|nr:hypothetical protein [Hyphomonadaceae bacterium]